MITRIALLAWLSLTAVAAGAVAGDVRISQAWARATAPGLDVGAVYFTIDNRGAADRLVGVSAPVAARAELHRTTTRDGLTRMERQSAVPVPARGTTEFVPGGLHVMLLGLEAPLAAGDTFPLTLTFERAGARTVDVTVRAPDAAGHPHAHGHDAPAPVRDAGAAHDNGHRHPGH